jgi:8-oxo-dGTP diphosphatase
VGRVPLCIFVLPPLGRRVFFLGSGLWGAGGHTPDRMGDSPLIAGWKTCPRCAHALEREPHAARCPNCGLSVYATPAPTASAILTDDDGRVMIARRSGDPGAGLWDLLGGFIEEGEDALEALHREVREETALEIEPIEFLGVYPDRYGDGGVYTLNLYWTARVTGGELRIDDELAEVAWVAPDELPADDEFAFANTIQALADWKARLGNPSAKK